MAARWGPAGTAGRERARRACVGAAFRPATGAYRLHPLRHNRRLRQAELAGITDAREPDWHAMALN